MGCAALFEFDLEERTPLSNPLIADLTSPLKGETRVLAFQPVFQVRQEKCVSVSPIKYTYKNNYIKGDFLKC